MMKDTQFCVVGNYLCHRHRSRQIVWITQLKEDLNASIPVNKFHDIEIGEEAQNNSNQSNILDKNVLFNQYSSKCLSIAEIVQK